MGITDSVGRLWKEGNKQEWRKLMEEMPTRSRLCMFIHLTSY